MKKTIAILLTIIMLFAFTACSGKADDNNTTANPSTAPAVSDENDTSVQTNQENTDSSKILIAYFALPEDVNTDGADAVAGASIVVSNGEKMGNTEYIARLIQKEIGGDLFRIETNDAYPLEHEALVDQAADEQRDNKRPSLSSKLENPEQYDTIILGYPNWWADLPMPVYTFLEEYDFSGKTIIPFVTHGGSGFSNTRNTIADLQPNAQVSDNTLSLSRNDVASSESEVAEWAKSLH